MSPFFERGIYLEVPHFALLGIGEDLLRLIQPQSKVTRAAIFVYIQLVHAVAQS